FLIGLPVWPRHSPPRTRSQNEAIRSSTSWTSLTTSTPSTTSERSRGIRSATWSTERFSETLIRSPRNIASRRSGTPHSSASVTGSAGGGEPFGLGADRAQQVLPGLDERLRPLALEPRGELALVDPGGGEFGQHLVGVPAVGRQELADLAVVGEGEKRLVGH